MSISRLKEIIKICKEEGVQKIEINGDVSLELFPFAVSLGAVPKDYDRSIVDPDNNLGHNDEKTDMDLLMHSAR